MSKSWKLREGVSSLAMDSKDTHLAAGGEAGAVQLVSIAVGSLFPSWIEIDPRMRR